MHAGVLQRADDLRLARTDVVIIVVEFRELGGVDLLVRVGREHVIPVVLIVVEHLRDESAAAAVMLPQDL